MRRSKKYSQKVRPLDAQRLMGGRSYATGPGGFEYIVQQIPQARKQYACPGCNGVVMIGEAHIVAWTEEGWFGKEAGHAIAVTGIQAAGTLTAGNKQAISDK